MSVSKFLKNKKGQTLSLTIFIILISLGTSLVFFMPINQQVIRLRKLLNSFQALAYSESGIEFADKNIGGFASTTATSSFPGSPCERFAIQFYGENLQDLRNRFNICQYIKKTTSTQSGNITIEIYNSYWYQDYMGNEIYSKVISLGEFKKIQKVIGFDYLPQPSQ